MRALLIAPLLLLAAAAAAAAQPVDRGWFTINVGAATGSKAFTDTGQTPLNQETETITTSYPAGSGGAGLSGGGGFRVWKQLAVGVGLTTFSHKADATIDASVPHPFFDNQPRAISGTTSTTHEETSFDVKIGIFAALSPKLRLLVAGGPSFMNVTQTIVTGVNYTDSYPYDTATFTGATTHQNTNGAAGFNAGADVFWLFSAHVGAGGMIQVTHARVTMPVNDRTISLDAGGVIAGGGIRVVF